MEGRKDGRKEDKMTGGEKEMYDRWKIQEKRKKGRRNGGSKNKEGRKRGREEDREKRNEGRKERRKTCWRNMNEEGEAKRMKDKGKIMSMKREKET